MNLKHLTCGSAIALTSASLLTAGTGVACTQPCHAPCQFGNCQGPGGPPPGGQNQGRPPGDQGRPGWARWAVSVGPRSWLGATAARSGWRGIGQGRRDHQPFNYNGSWVTPI